LFEDRVETVVTKDKVAQGSLVNAKLSKVAAFSFCKNKFYIFLASTKSAHARLCCHCFCLPSKDEVERLAASLPGQLPVLRLPEKGHRRTRSLPSIPLPQAGDLFISSHRISSFPTMLDLSSFTDTEGASPSCSQRSSFSQLHLSSAYMSRLPSPTPDQSAEDACTSDDESIAELEMFAPW